MYMASGGIDALVKLYSIGKMFPEKSNPGGPRSTHPGRVVVPTIAIADSSNFSALEHVSNKKSEHLFDSSTAE